MIPLPLDIIAAGAVSAAGHSIPEHLAFLAGQSAQRQRTLFSQPEVLDGELESYSAGAIDVRAILRTPKSAKFMSREMVLACFAAKQLQPHAAAEDPESVAIVLATAPAMSMLEEVEAIHRRCTIDGVLQPSLLAADLPALIPATWPSRCIKATTACHLAAEFGWVGPNLTLTHGRNATFSALFTAALLLGSGTCESVLMGGADCRTDRHSVIEAVTRWRDRLGGPRLSASAPPYKPSEGAGLLLLGRAAEHKQAAARIIGHHRASLGLGAGDSVLLPEAVETSLALLAAQSAGRVPKALWLDLTLDLAEQASCIASCRSARCFAEVYIVREQFGDSGVASAALALSVASARAKLFPDAYQVVLSACKSELQGIAIGSAP